MSDKTLQTLREVLAERKGADPGTSYVASLHAKGLNKICEKVGEEAIEVILAARDAEVSGNTKALVSEVADLWFHSLVLLSHLGEDDRSIMSELEKRAGTSGLIEKASRSKPHPNSSQ